MGAYEKRAEQAWNMQQEGGGDRYIRHLRELRVIPRQSKEQLAAEEHS